MSRNLSLFTGANGTGADLPFAVAPADEPYAENLSERKLLSMLVALMAGSAPGIPFTSAVATFTRPANTTAYASGDLVANNVTAGSVTPMTLTVAGRAAGRVRILRARLRKSAVSVTSAAFRVHLFTVTPTVSNGDNGVLTPLVANYVGALDVTSMVAGSDQAIGYGVPLVGTEIALNTAANTQTIFALLEARGAYTPASAETFSLSLEGLQG